MRISIAFLICSIAVTGCTPQQVNSALEVAKDIWSIAKALCLASHADRTGVSVEEAAKTVCQTKDQLAPWVDPVLGAMATGSAAVGLPAGKAAP